MDSTTKKLTRTEDRIVQLIKSEIKYYEVFSQHISQAEERGERRMIDKVKEIGVYSVNEDNMGIITIPYKILESLSHKSTKQ